MEISPLIAAGNLCMAMKSSPPGLNSDDSLSRQDDLRLEWGRVAACARQEWECRYAALVEQYALGRGACERMRASEWKIDDSSPPETSFSYCLLPGAAL